MTITKSSIRGTLFMMLMVLSQVSLSQDKESLRFAKRIEPIAKEYYRIGDYKRALEGYLVLDSIIPQNTEYNYRIGICYLNSNFKSKAYPYLEFAYNQDDAPENIFFELGRAYHYGLEFEKAMLFYESYKMQLKFSKEEIKDKEMLMNDVDLYIQMCKNGQRLVRDPIINTRVLNMGPEINSEYTDFAPLLNKDENLLIFSSKRQATPQTKSDPLTDQFYESIFYSTGSSGKWEQAKSIGAPLHHDDLHDAAVGLSPKGTSLFLYLGGDNVMSSKLVGNLYISNQRNGKWTDPVALDRLNSDGWESHATITEDEKFIVFTSDREGGTGGTDLYYSRKKLNGQWSEPENMGEYINTKYDEDGPFIHPDGNKLYFSSKGHNSMGGFDIFYSDYIVDKQHWSRPKNLGYPINSADDDLYFVWSADGKRAYFSSEREDTYGDADIYMLIRDDENINLSNLNGIVKDKMSGVPLTARILIRDKLSNNLIGIYDAGTDGSFNIELISERKYDLIIQSEGYQDLREIIDLNGLNSKKPDTRIFEIRKR